MDQATAITGREKYKTSIESSGHTIISDEPLDLDGKNLGMNPGELLCGSLASCTSITLRMYIDRKEWDVEEIRVDVQLNNEDKDNPVFERVVEVNGNLDEHQKSRLLSIANACPIHKLLSRGIEIRTEVKQ